ncbi:MAG: Tfp pilus assembly protein PilV [Pseudohongiellaceae bacterium]|jgi:Tfp pilus assembly protein PilV
MKLPPTELPSQITSPKSRSQSGFTLAEVLVAGILGAILLTAVSDATFSFAFTVAHLEETQGQADDEDTVMRLMTRDIRESWWAEIESSSHLKLQNDEGNFTEYYLNDGDVVKIRTDGSMDTLFEGVAGLSFTGTTDERLREGPAVAMTGLWYDHGGSAFPAVGMPISVGSKLSLAFTVPAIDSDLPTVLSSNTEEILGTSLGSISVPVAWIPGSTLQNLSIKLYETRGPGQASPRGTALGSISLPGSSLPAASSSGGSWAVPSTNVTINLNNIGGQLIPGAGYSLVVSATGDAQVVVAAQPVMLSNVTDSVAIKDASPGSQYVEISMAVDYSLSGSHSMTSTTNTPALNSVTVVLTPDDRPSQTRSASLLSQIISESPWYGVLEDESAP